MASNNTIYNNGTSGTTISPCTLCGLWNCSCGYSFSPYSATATNYICGSCCKVPCACSAITINSNYCYLIVKTPVKKHPEAVWLNGMMMSMGIFQSQAQCSYIGGELFFKDNTITFKIHSNKSAMIIQYSDYIYHYSFESPSCIRDELKLLCKIKRK